MKYKKEKEGYSITYTEDDIKEILEKERKVWLNKNAHKAMMMSASIIPMSPPNGMYFNVNGIEVSESLFPDEYKIISEQYFKVIDKYKNYCKNGVL